MRRLTSLLLAVTFATSATAEMRHYHVAPGKHTSVRFDSKARIERFGGKSDALSGWFSLDPNSLDVLAGELVLDLLDLDTGIGLRNNHMREMVLHTDRFPTATLVLQRCEGAVALSSSNTLLSAFGELTLHGVTRPIVAEIAARLEGDDIAFTARFDVSLTDFGMERPKMLMLKVAETVQLEVAARATPGPAPKRTP